MWEEEEKKEESASKEQGHMESQGYFGKCRGGGVDRAHAAWGNAECGVNGEIGTWGKEERMGVVKEPNKTWTSGNGEECNPPRPLEKKKITRMGKNDKVGRDENIQTHWIIWPDEATQNASK